LKSVQWDNPDISPAPDHIINFANSVIIYLLPKLNENPRSRGNAKKTNGGRNNTVLPQVLKLEGNKWPYSHISPHDATLVWYTL